MRTPEERNGTKQPAELFCLNQHLLNKQIAHAYMTVRTRTRNQQFVVKSNYFFFFAMIGHSFLSQTKFQKSLVHFFKADSQTLLRLPRMYFFQRFECRLEKRGTFLIPTQITP